MSVTATLQIDLEIMEFDGLAAIEFELADLTFTCGCISDGDIAASDRRN
jgi:hypothetical protein